jgi:APA family basic amino acid/polyamine antiporter
MTKNSDPSNQLQRQLSLFDAIMIVAGIVIGSGIFLTTGIMAESLPSASWILIAWLVGSLITLCGGLVYAELGAAMPEAGGQYVYLREAYGNLVAFLNGWVIFLVYMCGGIAMLAVAFSEYFGALIPFFSTSNPLLVIGGFSISVGQVLAFILVMGFSVINYVGVLFGKNVQNLLSVIKLVAIGFFIIFGLFASSGNVIEWSLDTGGLNFGELVVRFGAVLLLVFWAFDGWNNVNFVAGEIRDPARNVPRTLLISISLISLVYLLINYVYFKALPMSEIIGVVTIAESASTALLGSVATLFLTLAILVAIASSLNGSVMVGARVYYAMAKDGVFFKKMADIHPRFQTPGFSIIVQGLWSGVLVFMGNVEQLFTYMIFSAIIFWVITVWSVFTLRRKRPDLERPYKTWGYPVTPIIFILACIGLLINTLFESPTESLFGLGITALGIPAYFYWRNKQRTTDNEQLTTNN